MSKQISIATASIASVPLIHTLAAEGHRVRVFIPEKYEILKHTFRQNGAVSAIDFFDTEMMYNHSESSDWFISMGLPQKIDLIKLRSVNAINIHFGPLPENRGPDPLFRTIREGKSIAYITIHELTDRFDAGPVLIQKGFSIFPGENYGLLASRLGSLTPPLIMKLFQNPPEPLPQIEGDACTYPRPSRNDFTINWQEMSAGEIENVVNAANPKYNGAITTLIGSSAELRILEVSPAEIDQQETNGETPPGMVVLANHQGVFVQCRDGQFLRLNVVSTNGTILSGQKLAALGLNTGVQLQ